MANKNFGQFTQASSINTSDHIVGYTNTNPSGERRWTLETLMKAINNVPYARLSERAGVYSSISNVKAITGSSQANYNPAVIVLPGPTASGQNNVQVIERTLLLAKAYNDAPSFDTIGLTTHPTNPSGNITFSTAGVYEISLQFVQLFCWYTGVETAIDFVFEKADGTQLIAGPSYIAKPLNAGGLSGPAFGLSGRVSLAANDVCRVKIRSNQGGASGKEPITAMFPSTPATLFQLEIWKVG